MSSRLFFFTAFCTSIILTLATPLLGNPMERVDPKTATEDQGELRARMITGTSSRDQAQEAIGIKDAPLPTDGAEAARPIKRRKIDGNENDGPNWNSAPTILGRVLADLHISGLGHLVADFLVSDVENPKKEREQAYSEALNNLKALSPAIADALNQEPLPKTEEETQVFKTKYKKLIQTSA